MGVKVLGASVTWCDNAAPYFAANWKKEVSKRLARASIYTTLILIRLLGASGIFAILFQSKSHC